MKTSNIYNKHLNLSKRLLIEQYLNEGKSIKTIAELISKSKNTIYYEISNRRSLSKGNSFNTSIEYLNSCNIIKKKYRVCNGCKSKYGCRKNKYYYIAEDAQELYKNKLSLSREGINLNPEEFREVNEIIHDGIKKGQSFYMIYYSNKNKMPVKVRTLYNYQEKEYFNLTNSSLPRKCRYKKRDVKKDAIIRYHKNRIGRTYEDYKRYFDEFYIEHGYEPNVVLMDTVEGIKGEDQSVLLTLLFTTSNFLMAFKMKHKTIECVNEVFDYLKCALEIDLFYELFSVILTDNGSEFYDPEHIEKNIYGEKESKVFYCDPNRSDQKAKIEVTHEFIRRYIPKGHSFNDYSQQDIDIMINNINAVVRNIHSGLSAYDIQILLTNSEFLELLGYYYITPKDVILNKSLFKK